MGDASVQLISQINDQVYRYSDLLTQTQTVYCASSLGVCIRRRYGLLSQTVRCSTEAPRAPLPLMPPRCYATGMAVEPAARHEGLACLLQLIIP